jgi:predicted kinase
MFGNKKFPELVITIGNIGTGKSTIVKKYVKEGYIVIARDSLRYGIGGGKYIFDLKLEPIIWDTELFMFKKFARMGKNIVVDEVGINRAMRKRYIRIIKNSVYPAYDIIALVMPRLSMKEAVNRRMREPHGQPSRKLWESVWKNFDSQYEPPTKAEGFTKIIQLRDCKK